MQYSKNQQKKVTLNLTSLMDIMFILIIFFTITSTFLEQPGIELKLPEAESSETYTAEKVIVFIDAQGAIYINKNKIQLDELASTVSELLHAQSEKTVVLRADEQTAHGLVIKVMDLLRKKGIYKIIVSTSKP
jgi:biopolymer transport protein ExbD